MIHEKREMYTCCGERDAMEEFKEFRNCFCKKEKNNFLWWVFESYFKEQKEANKNKNNHSNNFVYVFFQIAALILTGVAVIVSTQTKQDMELAGRILLCLSVTFAFCSACFGIIAVRTKTQFWDSVSTANANIFKEWKRVMKGEVPVKEAQEREQEILNNHKFKERNSSPSWPWKIQVACTMIASGCLLAFFWVTLF